MFGLYRKFLVLVYTVIFCSLSPHRLHKIYPFFSDFKFNYTLIGELT